MSASKHVTAQDTDQNVDSNPGWNYIKLLENEVVTSGVAYAQTQTDWGPFENKETQTSNPIIMHLDLTRTNSKLRTSSEVDTDDLAAPFFQFERQAPGRISTSPTLRRIRSNRRPQMDSKEPVRMKSTQEEPPSGDTSSSVSPLSPVQGLKSPLAASPLSDGKICQDNQPISSSGRQRTRSLSSKTFDKGIASRRQESQSARPTGIKDFEFPVSEAQVSF